MTSGTYILFGAGRVGKLFSRSLNKAGWTCIGLVEPDDGRAAEFLNEFGSIPRCIPEEGIPSAEMFLFCVPDDTLSGLAASLDLSRMNTSHLVHTSGYHDSGIFPEPGPGMPVFSRHSIHPLISVPRDDMPAEYLEKAPLGLEGDDLPWMQGLAESMGCGTLDLNGKNKKLYHTAAVLSGNLILAVMRGAAETAHAAGFTESEFHRSYGPLLRSVLENSAEYGLDNSLSGPLQRKDNELIEVQTAGLRDAGLVLESELYTALVQYLRKNRETES